VARGAEFWALAAVGMAGPLGPGAGRTARASAMPLTPEALRPLALEIGSDVPAVFFLFYCYIV